MIQWLAARKAWPLKRKQDFCPYRGTSDSPSVQANSEYMCGYNQLEGIDSGQ